MSDMSAMSQSASGSDFYHVSEVFDKKKNAFKIANIQVGFLVAFLLLVYAVFFASKMPITWSLFGICILAVIVYWFTAFAGSYANNVTLNSELGFKNISDAFTYVGSAPGGSRARAIDRAKGHLVLSSDGIDGFIKLSWQEIKTLEPVDEKNIRIEKIQPASLNNFYTPGSVRLSFNSLEDRENFLAKCAEYRK